MKFNLLLLVSAVAAQDTFPCEKSVDCRDPDILDALNEKYKELGQITASTAVCMTIAGENQGNEFTTSQCGAIDWCGT